MAELHQIIHTPVAAGSGTSLNTTAKDRTYQGIKFKDSTLTLGQAFSDSLGYVIRITNSDTNLDAHTVYLYLNENKKEYEQYVGEITQNETSFVVYPRRAYDTIVITRKNKSQSDDSWDAQTFTISYRPLDNASTDNSYPWYRIGIQGLPGARFTINEEDFIIGKTGVFELTEDIIEVNQFSIVDIDKPFIIDYQTGLDASAENGNSSSNGSQTITAGNHYPESVMSHEKNVMTYSMAEEVTF